MDEYYKCVELGTWADFKELAENSRLEWIYRGESNSKWDLETTLDRSKITKNYPEFEERLYKDFSEGAKFHLDHEEGPTSMLESFSMLQHFGAPSRLLDFTKSPYIAAYFAFENTNDDIEKIGIWIVNRTFLYTAALNFFEKNKTKWSSQKPDSFDDGTFAKVFHDSKRDDFNCVFPVESLVQNQRYNLQQSIFLVQGNPNKSFQNQLEFIKPSLLNEIFMKVTIPTSEKKKAIRDLIQMNITRATLFPGLDGFAKSLLMKYSNLANIGEISEWLKYAQNKGLA